MDAALSVANGRFSRILPPPDVGARECAVRPEQRDGRRATLGEQGVCQPAPCNYLATCADFLSFIVLAALALLLS
jgi:hypothetical protein